MGSRIRLTAALAALVLLAFAVSADAQKAGKGGKPLKVVLTGNLLYHAETLTPGVKAFTVTCPAGFTAAGGGVFIQGAGVKQLKSVPGPRADQWRFGYGYAGTGQTTVIVVLTCVKPAKLVAGKKIKLKVSTITGTKVRVAAGATTEIKTRCPAGSAPAAAGADTAPVASATPKAGAARDAAPSQVMVEARIMPVRGGFETTWHNPSQQAFDVTPVIRCARRTFRAGRRKRRRRVNVEIVRRSFDETAGPMRFNQYMHGCGRGRFPISSGHAWDPGKNLLLTADPIDRVKGAGWTIQNGMATAQALQLYVLCVRGRITRQFDG